jgi:hypothetical protein
MFLPTILFQPAIGSVKFRRVIPFSESEQSNVGHVERGIYGKRRI